MKKLLKIKIRAELIRFILMSGCPVGFSTQRWNRRCRRLVIIFLLQLTFADINSMVITVIQLQNLTLLYLYGLN